MFTKALSEDTKKALALLGKSKILEKAYLAGGTALALQIGHRLSFDLDFFTPREFDEKMLVQRIKKHIPGFQLEQTTWQTVIGYIGNIRFSLFFYDYPLLYMLHKFLEVDIADIKDIAPMKIAAISDRGRKRDFIDLYFIVEMKKVLSLLEILHLYDQKFKILKQNKIHILKSLCYFEDAEKDQMPQMIEEVEWQEVKRFFEKEIKKISNQLLN